MKSRIIITDEVITDAQAGGMTVTDMLAQKYAGEIADKVKSDARLADLDAFQLALIDAGVTKHTPIQDLYKTDGGDWLFPVFIDRRLREKVGDYDILPCLISSTETVNSMNVQGAKLDMTDPANKDAIRKKDVAEAADLPEAVLRLAETAYKLYKRGRAVRASYEAYMLMPIDLFGRHLDMIAADTAGQQAGDAIKILVRGDGNDNKTPVVTLGGSGGLTPDELAEFAIEYWMKAKVPLNTIITGDREFYKQLLLMTYATTDANGFITGARFNFPQAQLSEITVLFDERANLDNGGKSQLIGLNRDQAITKYVLAGSQIREYDRNIKNQTHLGTVSEWAGFGKFNDDATLILRSA